MRDQARTKGTAGLVLLTLAVFMLVLAFTLLSPLVADDYNYAFSWAEDKRVENLGDVWFSIKCHRLYTNGRVFSHGFVQLFSTAPHWAFALCNAAAAAGQALLLSRLLRRTERPLAAAATALMLLWICMPVFGQVYLWMDGACNYSWGLLLALALLVPFVEAWEGEQGLSGPGLVLALPLAFVAGAWSEHISFSLLVACALLFLLTWRRSCRFPGELFLLLLSGGLGYLYLVLAPSSLGANSSRVLELPLILQALAERLDPILSRIPGGLLTLLLLTLLALAALCLCGKKLGWRRTLALLFALLSALLLAVQLFVGLRILRAGGGVYELASSTALGLPAAYLCFCGPFAAALFGKADGKRLVLPALLFLSGLASVALFVVASYFPPRGSAVSVLLSILGGVLAADAAFPLSRNRIIMALIALVFALCFALGTADTLAVHRSELQRQEQIREARESDGVLIALPHPVRSKYSAQYGLADLNPEGSWPGDVIARYYELRQARSPETGESPAD